MKPAVVKTEAQYREYLARIEELVALDPEPESRDGGELELLSLLVEDYENKNYIFEKPDPVEAVRFRMLEQDLRQVDLVPYFGTRSRVSEFLARQRPLTVAMIRDLSSGLGIPADVLIQESVSARGEEVGPESDAFDWTKFPISEMVNRGWLHLEKRKADAAMAAEAVREYIQQALGGARTGVLAKRTVRGDAFSWPALYALTAWQARVLEKARSKNNRARTTFEIDVVNEEFFGELVRLSRDENGPIEAIEALRDIGIAVVIEEHLSKTKLDGAAMLAADGSPVIGLTLRFDRIDNFWFTLVHECVHVWKHLSNPGDVFLDRLMDKEATEQVEKEANRIARDLLIPRSHWRSASVRQMPTRTGVLTFAEEVGIHPAIVAGRIQRETENYRTLSDLVGQGEIRKLFADE